MNKGILAGAGVIIVILLIGAIFLLGNKNTSQPDSEQTESMVLDNNSGEMPSSLRDLVSFANNQRCTFSDSESNTSGTVYASGGRVRGDFSTLASDETYVSHMISNNESVYVWTDNESQGYKMSFDDIEKFNAEAGSTGTSAKTFDPEKKVDFSCSAWTADNSQFDLPQNVEFSDLNKLMESVQELQSDESGMMDNESQCAICDSLEGEASVQCEQALGC